MGGARLQRGNDAPHACTAVACMTALYCNHGMQVSRQAVSMGSNSFLGNPGEGLLSALPKEVLAAVGSSRRVPRELSLGGFFNGLLGLSSAGRLPGHKVKLSLEWWYLGDEEGQSNFVHFRMS